MQRRISTQQERDLQAFYAKEQIEIAATERTFDLGYTRTALGAISIALLLVRLYSLPDINACGMQKFAICLMVYGVGLYIIGWVSRRYRQRKLSDDVQAAQAEVSSRRARGISMQELGQHSINVDPQQQNYPYRVSAAPTRQELLQELASIYTETKSIDLQKLFPDYCSSSQQILYYLAVPAGEWRFTASYFDLWRAGLQASPTPSVFETSGRETLLAAVLGIVVQVVAIQLLWKCG